MGRVPLVLLVAGLGAYALTQLIEAVFRPAHATGTMGQWRQRAVSSWGCLLYSAFCLTTARLVVQAQPRQTAQSEQRQDTDVTADLLRTGWGRALLILVGVLVVVGGVETGRRSVRLDFQERFTKSTCPGRWPCSASLMGAALSDVPGHYMASVELGYHDRGCRPGPDAGRSAWSVDHGTGARGRLVERGTGGRLAIHGKPQSKTIWGLCCGGRSRSRAGN